MSLIGKPYKKTVELRKGTTSDVEDSTLITLTNPDSTEDFNLDRSDFEDALSIPDNTVEVMGDYTALIDDDVIFVTGSATITLLDPTAANKQVTIRNISGTTTIQASSGTVETASLSTGQASTMSPRATGWFEI